MYLVYILNISVTIKCIIVYLKTCWVYNLDEQIDTLTMVYL